MDPLLFLVGALALALVFTATLLKSCKGQLTRTSQELNEERGKVAAAHEAVAEHMRIKTEAETRLRGLEEMLQQETAEKALLAADRDAARDRQREAEKQAALALQHSEQTEARMADWEKTKQELMKESQAAMLKTATDLSSKLLSDHKRESEAAKEETEKRIQKTTEALVEQFETISRSVHTLNQQIAQNRVTVETIQRALSSPDGAGQAAETVLENTLKSFGLAEGRDFVLQRSFKDGSGDRLRPDAIIFLPGDTVMVIDSKATKFLLELAAAEDETAESGIYAQIKNTMNAHLRALAGKDYKNVVIEEFRRTGAGRDLRHVMSLMWLPNDGALEKVERADRGFRGRAFERDILIVGPSALWASVCIASQAITLGRQAENQEKIVAGVQSLLDSVGVMLDHADGVGRGLKTAADRFTKMSSSINGRLLPRVRKLTKLGIQGPSKGLPGNIPSYQVVSMEAVIDAESEEIPAPRKLLPQRAFSDD